jgi:hypothetical protein
LPIIRSTPVHQSDVAAAGSAPARRGSASAAWELVSTVALTSLFVFFAAVHLQHWRATGEPTGLGLVAQEALAAALFLFRRKAARVSGSPRDWLLAMGGSWLILAARPAGPALFGLDAVATAVQLAGFVGAVAGLGVLGRSFGIVAADRGLRTAGPYRIVRHPVYASYLVTQLGYLLQNPSLLNLLIVATVNLCQVGRIRAEEAVLRGDPEYRRYAATVRFRLVPGLF